jgi:hypothetical protein
MFGHLDKRVLISYICGAVVSRQSLVVSRGEGDIKRKAKTGGKPRFSFFGKGREVVRVHSDVVEK